MAQASSESGPRVSAHPLLYIITVIVVLNLALTAWFVIARQSDSDTEVQGPSVVSDMLPPQLTPVELDRLFADVQRRFNSRDGSALYDLLGQATRIHYTEEDMKRDAAKMYEMLGTVVSGTYSHHEYIEREGSQARYQLVYVARFTAKECPRGKILVDIYTTYGGYEIASFRFTAGT